MAKLRLTVRSIASLRPTDTRVDYFDDALPGFFLRVTPTGIKTFGVIYRHAGRKRRFTIGTSDKWSLADARDHAREAIRASAKDKRDMAAEKRDDRQAETFGELAEQYIARWARKRKRSWPEDQRIVDTYLNPRFRNVRATEVRRADVRGLLEEIASEAPIMANRVLACIRKIYNWGISNDLVEWSPCVKLMAPAEERRRDRVLTDAEIKKLWAALDASTSAVADTYRLRLLTAQRGGEVTGMRWGEVDLDGRWWTIPAERSKNRMPHRVWLSDPVVRILERAHQRETERERRRADRQRREPKRLQFVFPGRRQGQPIVEAKRVKAEIAKAAGIDGWTGHDLRRTAASHMTAMGVTRITVGRLLNHAEPEVTAVYDRHSYDPEKRTALDQWARRLLMIVSELRSADEGAS
jgi:integrase